ncbi:MAG: carbon starvation protein A [Kiritimatiellia bacterium]
MIALFFLAGGLIFALAYRWYGRYLERSMDLDDRRPTPAFTMRDDVDYLPTSDPVLFGHHFSSIAGAGPIVGPIIAGLAFGWLPAALWILAGAVLVGGVHDYTALAASIRHGGLSIAEICRSRLPRSIYLLFLVFILLTLIYVIIVFLDLTATGFAPPTTAPVEALRQGGAVATASMCYILLALVFGYLVQRRRWSLSRASLAFVPLIFVAIWIGLRWPLLPEYLPALGGSVKNFWILLLLGYCLVASVLPVWVLLQPRDYLSSFLLYACLAGGATGLLAAGWRGMAPISYPAFIGWSDPQLGLIFPALFITVACGAVSGFHAIVASGTSAKQLRHESSARRIGYGSMLVEGLLALLALGTIMILGARPAGSPVGNFAAGLGLFISALGIPQSLASTFAMLAVSTFLLTTLDTCTRLARFVFQELSGILTRLPQRIASSALVLLVPALVTFRKIPGPGGQMMPAWQAIWPAFGATNQLLAALALLCVFLWLRSEKRPCWFVVLPMVFMAATTLTALAQLAWLNLDGGSRFIGWMSLALCLMALLVMTSALALLHRAKPDR